MGRYIITSVTLRLYKATPQPPFYKAVQDYLDAHSITIYTPQTLRDAVIAIRADKLPDPKERPNNGSFFKNAVVEDWQLADLKKEYPDIPTYNMPDGRFKVPTGWLIEQAGLKGQLLHGMRVHDKNALVLINEGASGYADLAAARDEIIGAVRDKFRVQIEQEPLEI
jgi:UDP-N-acetylmuramate dehydrogenase